MYHETQPPRVYSWVVAFKNTLKSFHKNLAYWWKIHPSTLLTSMYHELQLLMNPIDIGLLLTIVFKSDLEVTSWCHRILVVPLCKSCESKSTNKITFTLNLKQCLKPCPKSYPKLTPPTLKEAKVNKKETQPYCYAFNVGFTQNLILPLLLWWLHYPMGLPFN
jgi:hypothetical protein